MATAGIESQLEGHPPPDNAAVLQPFQFGLRTLFWGMTALCGVFAIGSQIGGYPALILFLIGSLIAAHVAGNVIGTGRRNRAATDENVQQTAVPVQIQPSSPTLLQAHVPLSRRTLLGSGIGAFIGVSIGVGGTAPSWAVLGLLGVLIVGVSSGVIGLLAGFMASRFASAFGRAFSQAIEQGPGVGGQGSGRS